MNNPAEKLIDDLHWSADGCATLTGALYEWASRFDAHLSASAASYGAADYRFPSLIAAKSLAPIAYLRSFPHLATFVTSGRRDDAALHALAKDSGTAEQIDVTADRFDAVDHLLTPATCYHFYPLFAGQHIDAPLLLTARCQCFRRETHYVPLERQWCFEMREVVCIGDAGDIDEFVSNWSTAMESLAGTLGLFANWQTATDPFFDPQGDPKALAQIIEPSKQELCVPGGLAIGSVNKHRSFFGESYQIHCGAEPAQSACVAFGIERWLSAMVDVHGPDVATWPNPGEEQ